MAFVQTLVSSIRGSLRGLIYALVLPMIPFIILEQIDLRN
jgi:hypothetical protein